MHRTAGNGIGIRVGMDARLDLSETAALRWALQKIEQLTSRGVVDVPAEHAEDVGSALRYMLRRLDQAEAWATAEPTKERSHV